jgi:hypothetical protein
MSLGTETETITRLLASAGIDPTDLAKTDYVLSDHGTDLRHQQRAFDVRHVVARGSDDDTASVILKAPQDGLLPTTCSQIVVTDVRQAIALARLANHIAVHDPCAGCICATQQALAEMLG